MPDFSSTIEVIVMIKMFLDDSLHHTYMYVVDQPYKYFHCSINLGHYLILVLLVAVLVGNATFLQ